MPSKPSSARSLVPARTGEAWALALLGAIAGSLVGASFGGLVGKAKQVPALSLEPYLDPTWTNVAVGWIGSSFDSPLFAAIALGAATASLVLFCDAVIRLAFLASNPAAAALGAVTILLAAAWGGVLRLEGHSGILAGFLVAPAGCLLILEGRGALVWVGGFLAALAAGFHPAFLGVAPVVIACAPRRISLFHAVLAAGLAGLPRVIGDTSTGVDLAFVERLRFAASDLAAAPVLAFSPWRRFDVPTGYEPLVSSAPVIAGLAAHALLLGLGMMIGGVRRGLVVASAAAVSVFGAAVLVPGYVPGNRAFVLTATTAYAPLVALALSVVPRRLAKSVMPGLILGTSAIAVMLANDRAESWTRIGAAMHLPERHDFTREPDLARLVLYLHDVTLRDPDAKAVVDAADKLVQSSAPALFPERLKTILEGLTLRAGKPPKTPEFARLVAEIVQELNLAERLFGQSPRANFETVANALVLVQFKVLDLHFNWQQEPETVQTVQRFLRLARTIIPIAGKAAYYEYSIPLIQALQILGPDLADSAATIAIQQVLSGNLDEGRPALEGVLKRLSPKDPVAAVVRGLLGMTILAGGDPKRALTELQAAWSVIAAGGARNVSNYFATDSLDYSVVAEILLARFEAAKAIDPGLAAQAARDLEDHLKPLLSFGPRRTPALAIMGRLHLLLGERDRALRLLREARTIPSATLDDRADGPIGRIAHPRYRRLVLETLLLALGDGADVAAERDEVGAELARLAEK